jgi:hypothetical protein
MAALVACALALATLGGLVLTHRPVQTRPVPGTGRVSTRQPAVPLRSRSRISVLVLNGNGVEHAAGTEAALIVGFGYRHAIPADAPQLDYARSLVLYRPGWQREAERLARDSGIRTVATLDGRIEPAYAHVPLILILGAK